MSLANLAGEYAVILDTGALLPELSSFDPRAASPPSTIKPPSR
jgi:hypothetical protein